MGRIPKKPLVPLANAKPALILLRKLRAMSPFAIPKIGSPKQEQGPSLLTCVQNSRRRSTREFDGLPAMIAALIAPIDMPAIQSGWMPASARAS
jgi:hypothetical protein